MKNEINIIIADDHPIFREGLKSIIAADPGIKILGDAADGNAALKLIKTLRPDIAILDIDMPVKSGLDVIRELLKSEDDVKVIVLTMHKDERMVNNILDLKVMGYVLKESAINDIVDCIRSVSEGDHYISPLISGLLLKRRSRLEGLAEKNPGLESLTPTETKILKLIAENMSSKEIADLLFVNHRTVEKHRENISTKLDLQGSLSLVKFALENKSIL